MVTFEAIYAEYGVYFIENDTIYMNFILHKIPDRMLGDRHYRERGYRTRIEQSIRAQERVRRPTALSGL